MSWRDLHPFPDDWTEPEHPHIEESTGPGAVSKVTVTFTDPLTRQWFTYWLKSRRGWTAFTAWLDERR